MKSPPKSEQRQMFFGQIKRYQDEQSNFNNRWMTQLFRSVQNVTKKNQKKFQAIVKHHSNFTMKLYKPTIPSCYQKVSEINPQILMKQLDFLLQDQAKLDRQINKINFEQKQHQQLRLIETQTQMDHYSFLRSIWQRSTQEANIQDRLERLTQNIGSIKGHINTLIKKENNIENFQLSTVILQSKQYEKLKQKYERLSMWKEQIQLQLEQLKAQIFNKDNQISKFNKQYQYSYQSKHNLTILLGSSQVLVRKKFFINKKFQQIHHFLMGDNQDQIQEKNIFKIVKDPQTSQEKYQLIKDKVQEIKKKIQMKGVNQLKIDNLKRIHSEQQNLLDEEFVQSPTEIK